MTDSAIETPLEVPADRNVEALGLEMACDIFFIARLLYSWTAKEGKSYGARLSVEAQHAGIEVAG